MGEWPIHISGEIKMLDVNDLPPGLHLEEINYKENGIPFLCYPNKNDIHGVASRAAMLRYADIIAHDNLQAATNLRKTVIEIENNLGNTTS